MKVNMGPSSLDRRRQVLRIEGMSCSSCVRKVQAALSQVRGVLDCSVSLSRAEAVVILDGDAADSATDLLLRAVRDAGFGAEVDGGSGGGLERSLPFPTPVFSAAAAAAVVATAAAPAPAPAYGAVPGEMWTRFVFRVEGMTCGYCADTVAAAACSVSGVVRAAASFEGSNAVVTVASTGAAAASTAAAAADAIDAAGYRVLPVTPCTATGSDGDAAGTAAGFCCFSEGVQAPAEVAPQDEVRLTLSDGPTVPEKEPAVTAAVSALSAVSAGCGPAIGEVVIDIQGMTCAACSSTVSRILRKVPGVLEADVSLPLERATVRYDAAIVGPAELVRAVSSAGYDAEAVRGGSKGCGSGCHGEGSGEGEDGIFADVARRAARRRVVVTHERNRFLISLIFSAPLLVIDMGWMGARGRAAFETALAPGLTINAVVQWALATPVQFWLGAPYYMQAAMEIRHRALGMALLVAAGTSAAYLYSVIAVIVSVVRAGHDSGGDEQDAGGGGDQMAGWDLDFEVAAVLISFVLLGRWLEALARGRASNAVSKLLALAPRRAVLVKDWYGPANAAAPGTAAIIAAAAAATPAAVAGGSTAGPADSSSSTGAAPVTATASSRGTSGGGGDSSGGGDGPIVDAGGGTAWNEEEVDAALLAPGDVVKVVRGTRMPADGVVVGGAAAVDESMVTGESVPVARSRGAAVLAASLVVEGLAYVRVMRTGEGSTLARIARLVESAQASRAPIQAVGDAVAAVFVPCVLALAVATFMIWLILGLTCVTDDLRAQLPGDPSEALMALTFALSVLVIACPCAVGLAAPTAAMVGAAVAARCGVLLKGGEAVQAAAGVRAVLMDKTGTLTEGRPAVAEFLLVLSDAARKSTVAIRSGGIVEPFHVLRLIAAAETASEHPLARAIVEYARAVGALGGNGGGNGKGDIGSSSEDGGGIAFATGMESGSFRASSGRGMEATVDGIRVRVGSPSYVCDGDDDEDCDGSDENCVGGGGGVWAGKAAPLPPILATMVRGMQERGRTAVVAAFDGVAVAVLGVIDRLRPEAPGVVRALHRMGLEVWMVTGDNTAAARDVAGRVGILPGHVLAEVLPQHKAEKVRELQAAGKRTAMVGDGINDAPALAAADVGIAIGGGADVAVESADVVLMRPRLEDIVTALDLCRTILRRIEINFGWALGYNSVMLPVAAGVLFPATKAALPPQLAGALMALSSVSVVLSSTALRLYRPPRSARRLAAARAMAAAAKGGRGGHGGGEDSADISDDEDAEEEVAAAAAAAVAAAVVVVTTVDLDCRCKCCQACHLELGSAPVQSSSQSAKPAKWRTLLGGGTSAAFRAENAGDPPMPGQSAVPVSDDGSGGRSVSGSGDGSGGGGDDEDDRLLGEDGGRCMCNCTACGCARHAG